MAASDPLVFDSTALFRINATYNPQGVATSASATFKILVSGHEEFAQTVNLIGTDNPIIAGDWAEQVQAHILNYLETHVPDPIQ
jgi:hypothetical protein